MKKILIACMLMGVLLPSFKKKELVWVAIGDSITYLNDHTGETGDRITTGFMTGVVKKLPNIRYVNQGHNGWTSGGIADNIDSLGIGRADVYTIFLGTNDWWAGRPAGTLSDYDNNTGSGTVCGAFRIIIDKVRGLSPEAKLILMTPMQRADFVYVHDMKNHAYGSYKPKNGQTLERVANAIDSIGKMNHFTVLDLYHTKSLALKNLVKFERLKDPKSGSYKNFPYPDFIGIPFHPETDEYPYPPEAVNMTYDGLHPSDKGYDVITRLLVKELKKL